jgi:hypothetical protein
MLVELALSYNRINEPGHQKKEKVFPKKDGNVTLLFLFSSPLKWHLPPMYWNIRLCVRTKENVPSVRNGFLGPSRIGKKKYPQRTKVAHLMVNWHNITEAIK